MKPVTRSSRLTRATLLGMGLATLCVVTAAQATDIRHWKRTPIDVHLPVGTERIVVFGDQVRVGLPPELADPETLRVQSTNGAIYLKAKKAFDTQRVQIQDMETGRIMLFDFSAESGASSETIQVEDDSGSDQPGQSADQDTTDQAAAQHYKPAPPEAFGQQSGGGGAPIPVALVRHAAQALYSPQRILSGSNRIHRIAVGKRGISGLLPAYPVSATPIAAWREAPYTVTAIQITNRDPNRSFSLDPRNLAGDFYAASFMHQTIGPAGTLADTTTLYAVTKNGTLADALTAPAGDLATETDDAD